MLSTLLRNILTLPTLPTLPTLTSFGRGKLTSFGRGKLSSFGQDGPKWEGLTRKTDLLRNSFFYAFILHSNLRLDSVYGIKKPEPNDSGFLCSGDRTRTCDLRVMSPTSSQLLHPAMYLHCFILIFFDSLIEGYKGMIFFLIYQINRVKAAVFG